MNKDIHVPRIPKGCDQQGRHPEAAHAASEMEEWRHDPLWWVTEALICAALASVVLFLLIIVGLIP